MMSTCSVKARLGLGGYLVQGMRVDERLADVIGVVEISQFAE